MGFREAGSLPVLIRSEHHATSPNIPIRATLSRCRERETEEG